MQIKEYFWDKISLTSFTGTKLNAPVRNQCVSITFEELPFPIFNLCPFLSSSVWGHMKWFINYYGRLSKKGQVFLNKISLTGCQWSNLNALRSEPLSLIQFWRVAFLSHYQPLPLPSFLPSYLWGQVLWG